MKKADSTDVKLPSFWRFSYLFWIALILVLFGWLFQKIENHRQTGTIPVERMEETLHVSLGELERLLHLLVTAPDSADFEEILDRDEFAFYLFNQDSLVFWSDNTLFLPLELRPDFFTPGFAAFRNLYGICSRAEENPFTAVGVFKLQYRYPFENEYLRNVFYPGQDEMTSIRISGDQQGTAVCGLDGEPLFKVFRQDTTAHRIFWYLSLIAYSLGFLFFLIFLTDLAGLGKRLWKSGWWLIFLLADLFILRFILSLTGIPDVFNDLSVFTEIKEPLFLLESPGMILLTLVCLLFFVTAVHRHFVLYPSSVSDETRLTNPRLVDGFSTLGWLLVLLAFFLLYRFWLWLHAQAADVIELHLILSLNPGELWIVFLMILSGVISLMILFTIARQTARWYSLARLLVIPMVAGVIVFGLTRYAGLGPDTMSLVLMAGIVIAVALSVYRSKSRLHSLGILLAIALSAVFFSYFLAQANEYREKFVQQEIIDGLINEHDPIAEMILQRMDQDIVTDTVLTGLIRNPRVPEDVIENYLVGNRFGSYWNRYKINVNVCDSVNLMLISPENIEVPCFRYWEDIRINDGKRLGRSHFYYIDRFDGKIWYLGKFPVFTQDSSYAYHMWVSAESVLIPEGLGYPDVLIAGNSDPGSEQASYSYAKYEDCQLISHTGDFPYATSCELYPVSHVEMSYFEEGGHRHWLHRLDDSSMVIMSKPLIRLFDYLIAFSYLFVTFYLVWLIISAGLYLPARLREAGWDLKSKIQITIISTLVISFVLIGAGMSYFVINQYDRANRRTITEKVQSVLIEVQHKLEMEDQISAAWSAGDYPNLQSLLLKFAFVFNTDINLFDPAGRLVASSRPEVFNRQLTGNRMDPRAYHELAKMKKMEFIHREYIGELGFWSAYVPFYNVRGELLAYLNLPYFSKQSEIRTDIANFLVAILNGYFLLIFLAVILAVFLGNQITKPLQMLQERFTGMHLGARNTEIAYRRRDEIGRLVRAYNQMVRELEASADKLARSEREMAWREMARQIAHEIKNPLTPMKLSIQHLKRSWDDRVENWDDYLTRVTQTLVEQIDSLTAIANAFSQFAQMPRANREKINLLERIENAISLFSESGSSVMDLEVEGAGPFLVLADREQILQVLNNLFTNAIQAVPSGRDPQIRIQVKQINAFVQIAIQDNGSGIPEDMKEKLFQPNFTTKSSGMGLGLAIVRNIIENSDGRIWFETSEEGSVFYVELPLV